MYTIVRPRLRHAAAWRSLAPLLFRGHSMVLDIGDDFEERTDVRPKKSSARGKKRPIKYKFVDKANVRVQGGKGGDGCVSFEVIGPGVKHPSGGHGGAGGDVYVVADEHVESLSFERHHYNAANGGNGGARRKKGARGKDVVLRVPLGTVVKEVLGEDHIDYYEYDKNYEDGYDESDAGNPAAEYGDCAAEEHDGSDADYAGSEYHNRAAEDVASLGGSSPRFAASEEEDGEAGARAAMDGCSFGDTSEGGVLDGGSGTEKRRIIGVRGSGSSSGSRSGSSVGGSRNKAGSRIGRRVGSSGSSGGDSSSGSSSGDSGSGLQFLIDLDQHGASVLVARGGPPGLGSQINAGPRRMHTAAGVHKMPGAVGETRHLLLELKTIADIGLVGYPNAGKSTFLGAVSRAKPKVAPYPFTTLRPMVGRIEYSDTNCLLVADIPGLVEGAHENRGLGHEFLRHVERTAALVYVVDAAGSEGRDPVEDLLGLRRELSLYDPALAAKPAMVVANKSDQLDAAEHLPRLRAATPLWVVAASAERGDGVADAVVCMRKMFESC